MQVTVAEAMFSADAPLPPRKRDSGAMLCVRAINDELHIYACAATLAMIINVVNDVRSYYKLRDVIGIFLDLAHGTRCSSSK